MNPVLFTCTDFTTIMMGLMFIIGLLSGAYMQKRKNVRYSEYRRGKTRPKKGLLESWFGW